MKLNITQLYNINNETQGATIGDARNCIHFSCIEHNCGYETHNENPECGFHASI